MKCPFCPEEFTVLDYFISHLAQQYQTTLARKLAEMIAADMIPRAKVEAKIKELENHYTVGLNRFDKNWSDYDMATNANRAILSHLQELLNNTEKVEK